jgi:hypothetical protein
MPLTKSAADELKAIIDANMIPPLPGNAQAAPQSFCTVWPVAKPILQLIAGIAPLIPGVGVGAGAALTALIAAGQAVHDQTCGPTTAAAMAAP